MTCRELADFLDAYLDGALAAAEGDEFERHLGCCPECRTYLETYRRTLGLLRDQGADDAAAAGVPERLVQAILAARRRGEGGTPIRIRT